MSNYTDFFPAGGGASIASTHQGIITITGSNNSNTATIPAVDLANSVVLYLGGGCGGGTSNTQSGFARVDLTNSTTVTMTRQGGNIDADFAFMVVEFASGIASALQYNGALTASNVTITAVDSSKSILFYQGFSGVLTAISLISPTYQLTSDTNVSIVTNNVNGFYGFTVLEFA